MQSQLQVATALFAPTRWGLTTSCSAHAFLLCHCDGRLYDLLFVCAGAPFNGDLITTDSCPNQAKEAIINYKCVSPCNSQAVRTLTGCDDEVKTIR